MDDLISRQWLMECVNEGWIKFDTEKDENRFIHLVRDIAPSAQPEIEERMSETEQNVPNDDLISRKGAIDAIEAVFPVDPMKSEYAQGIACGAALAKTYVEQVPSVQPKRTCVNCGRTVNNGGWYADGGTRCPIEEHYALPKDGYCHLWEKRNVTDDDYPERREE